MEREKVIKRQRVRKERGIEKRTCGEIYRVEKTRETQI